MWANNTSTIEKVSGNRCLIARRMDSNGILKSKGVSVVPFAL